jgi:hypothetical protein
MAGIAPASVPHGSGGEPEKTQHEGEKRQQVTEQPPRSASSDYGHENDVQQEAFHTQGYNLEPTSTLGTIMSRMRSRASMVIEPPPDGGMAAWMVGEYLSLDILI